MKDHVVDLCLRRDAGVSICVEEENHVRRVRFDRMVAVVLAGKIASDSTSTVAWDFVHDKVGSSLLGGSFLDRLLRFNCHLLGLLVHGRAFRL